MIQTASARILGRFGKVLCSTRNLKAGETLAQPTELEVNKFDMPEAQGRACGVDLTGNLG